MAIDRVATANTTIHATIRIRVLDIMIVKSGRKKRKHCSHAVVDLFIG